MSRPRRALLATIASVSGLLAIDTQGGSSTQAERPVSMDVASDPDAFLSVTENGVDMDGHLFEYGTLRSAPASFSLQNQLTEPIDVELNSDTFDIDPCRSELAIGGETVVTVDLPADTVGTNGSIEIIAVSDSTQINADRSLTLVPDSISFTLCQESDGETCTDLEVGWDDPEHVVTVSSDDEEIPTQTDSISAGEQVSFELGKSGTWTVTDARPDAENTTSEPGESVTVEAGSLSVELDPNEPVCLTVAFSS